MTPTPATAPKQRGLLPQRIQLRRTRGWRMPTNTVKVDRTTKWGNPFYVAIAPEEGNFNDNYWCLGAEEAVAKFRRFLGETTKGARLFDEAKTELRGKNLGCWCREGDPCHGTVLLEIANRTP
jgi:hypothetical protein